MPTGLFEIEITLIKEQFLYFQFTNSHDFPGLEITILKSRDISRHFMIVGTLNEESRAYARWKTNGWKFELLMDDITRRMEEI